MLNIENSKAEPTYHYTFVCKLKLLCVLIYCWNHDDPMEYISVIWGFKGIYISRHVRICRHKIDVCYLNDSRGVVSVHSVDTPAAFQNNKKGWIFYIFENSCCIPSSVFKHSNFAGLWMPFSVMWCTVLTLTLQRLKGENSQSAVHFYCTIKTLGPILVPSTGLAQSAI